MGTVNLFEDMPCVKEQNRILPVSILFSLIKEPECTWQRDSTEEIGAHCYHHIHLSRFYDLLSDLQFSSPGITGRVGHHKTSPAFVI